MIETLKYRIINLTLFQLLLTGVIIFICYAIVDIYLKRTEHKKYDMQKIVAVIQDTYPQSTLDYQNIKIVDNQARRELKGNGSYYDTEHFYIRDHQFHIEPDYVAVIVILPALIFLNVFWGDMRKQKLKDLVKRKPGWLLVILAGTFVFYLWCQSGRSFDGAAESVINQINLADYEISNI